MRILQVFNRYLERGGEEASVERISNVLSSRHEVFHCYFDSRMWTYDASVWGTFRHVCWMFRNPEAIERFRRQVRACRPDLILVHNVFPVGSIGVLDEATRLNIPVFHVVHNFRPFSVNGYLWANNRLLPQGLKKNFLPEILAGAWQASRVKTALLAMVLWVMHALGIYRRIDCWLAISEFMRDAFVKAGLEPEKVRLLRHSWDALEIVPEFAENEEDGPYLLFLGRLMEAKGLDVLLQAWRQVAAVVPEGRLVICGTGPMEAEVRMAAEALPRCKYLGTVDGGRKARLIAGCTAMVVPSVWWEPLGLVVYEAYEYGKPVLAAAGGGLTETVVPGQTGWLHCPGDANELARQMIAALRNPEECRRRGKLGREWLLRNTRTKDWLDMFDEMAAEVISFKTDGQKNLENP